jgi:1-acyl-sn-glycerol-3-phosphate acyltransferase
MGWIRLLWKLPPALVHVAVGYFTIKLVFPRLDKPARERRVHVWSRKMLRIAGIDLVVKGTPSAGPALLVANHISWLDIMAMHATCYCAFVAKSDLKHWPLVGTLATGVGTLYIERASRRDAHRMVDAVASALKGSEVVAIFPEGTTGDGVTLKPFHANLLQAAIDAHAPIQPLSVRFVDAATGRVSFAPRYIDDDALVVSLWNTLTAARLRAEINFGEAQLAQGRTRREWAHALRAEIETLRDQQGPA